MRIIKIKKILKKSRNDAKRVYGLTDEEYDQINAYIQENNISSDTTILIKEKSSSPDILPRSKESETDKYKFSNKQEEHRGCGNYIFTSMQPGMPPQIQSSSTSPLLSKIMAGVSIAWCVSSMITQICFFIINIQERKAAKVHPIVPPSTSCDDKPGTNKNLNTL